MRLALVSMPFMPVTTPALGPSLLSSIVRAAGHSCEVIYGSLEFLSWTASLADSMADAFLDYSVLASTDDLGDVFFADQLWPSTAGAVDEVLARLATTEGLPLTIDERVLATARILQCHDRLNEFMTIMTELRTWADYDVIGFSSMFAQNAASLALARSIKQRALQSTIVFGGANAQGEMGVELIESFPWIDHVLAGEADDALVTYLDLLAQGRSPDTVPGITLRHPSGVTKTVAPQQVHHLDEQPDPDFADYFAQRPPAMDSVAPRTLVIELARGCWWGAIRHCIFCGLNPSGLNFRSRSPESALGLIHRLAKRWDCTTFMVVDNILDLAYFDTLLPALSGAGLTFFCEVKSNLREDQVARLACAGALTVQPGIESLSSPALALMRKGARALTQVELLKHCRNHDVEPLWFHLYDVPGERAEWYADSIELMARIPHLSPPRSANPLVVDRFSPMFDRPGEFGLGELVPAWHGDLVYAGVAPESRNRLAYHFFARVGHDVTADYESALRAAVCRWHERHDGGARLTQQTGECSTLVVDERSADRAAVGASAYLLRGWQHLAYRAMRRGQRPDALAHLVDGCPQDDATLSDPDLAVSLRAAALGAQTFDVEPVDLAGLLTWLDDASLVVRLDGKWLALATDAR